MDKNKYRIDKKPITIFLDPQLHREIKEFCAEEGYMLHRLCAKWIKRGYLEDVNIPELPRGN